MGVTAVVLTWNGKEDTLACLRSLEGEEVDVIVVDNASEDGTAEAVTGVELIRNERNLGYAGGMNVGIQQALERGTDAVLLLNNDVEVEPGAIEALVEAADGVGAVCPVIVFADDPERIWYSGARFDPRHGYNGRHRTDEPAGPRETERICGAAVLIPARSWKGRGLRRGPLRHVEDADWSLRAREGGNRLVVEPRSRVRHKVSASTGGEGSDSALYYSTRNTLAVCERRASARSEPGGAQSSSGAQDGPCSLRRPRRIGSVLEGWRDFRRGGGGPRR